MAGHTRSTIRGVAAGDVAPTYREERPSPERPMPVVDRDRAEDPEGPERVRVETGTRS